MLSRLYADWNASVFTTTGKICMKSLSNNLKYTQKIKLH